MLLPLDEDMAGELLEILNQRQLRRSTLMKNALSSFLSDIVIRKEPRSYQRLHAMVTDSLEDQRQNELISDVGHALFFVVFLVST